MAIKKLNLKIFILGVIISSLSFLLTFNYEIEKEKLIFVTNANKVFNNIKHVFSMLENRNKELISRFYLPREINNIDFKFFTSSIIKQNSFIESIFFAKSIKAESKLQYEAGFRDNGYTGFKIKPFQADIFAPSPETRFLLPVNFMEPYSVKNSVYFGRNLLTFSAISSVFSSSSLSKNLIYRGNIKEENSFYAVNMLYRGHKHLKKISLPLLYGVLLYKIKIETSNENILSLDIKVNNESVLNTYNKNKSFNIKSTLYKEINAGNKKIFIRLTQGKPYVVNNFIYPTIIFLFGLMLTALIEKNIRSHKKLNVLLRKQKTIIEDEVTIKTKELKTKSDELEAFSYSVSHDLKAPLHRINGFSELLQLKYSDSKYDDEYDCIGHIRTAADKMHHIITDLLSLSSLSRSKIKKEHCNISKIAERTITTLRDDKPNRKITINIAQNIYADVDPNYLQLCFDNLFSNAWKYTAKVESPNIEFGIEQQNDECDEVVYYVKDNGTGFNMRDSSKLFIPFQRLHDNSEFEGTGIGLMIVKRIVQKHNGRIWANSTVGQGATFYFTLK